MYLFVFQNYHNIGHKSGGANETVIHHVPQMYKWDYKRENKKSQHMCNKKLHHKCFCSNKHLFQIQKH